MDIALMNWPAVGLGTIAAFALGMLWFSPKLFGNTWSAGSHDIQPPDAPPLLAMAIQLTGTLVLALIIGITETAGAIFVAIGAVLAVALFVAGMDLFSQKSGKATWVDAGYVLACGVVMIAAQGIL